MHGITLTKKIEDWTILQHRDGCATVELKGTYLVHDAAIEVGVEVATPMVRIMSEEDNSCVLHWTVMDHAKHSCHDGEFSHMLCVPAGGLYRIETCLETKSVQPNLTWLYRGDCILHIGVGNVFIIAGQSNSSGYARDSAPDAPDIHVHLYRNRSRWDIATHPMNESTDAGSLPNEEMGVSGVSPYLSFAKEYYKLTSLPVGFVQTSLGGSPISRWCPTDGDLYQNMINKLGEVGTDYAGVLWYQGCSDTNPDSAPLYLDKFCELVSALRAHLGYEIPWFTFQLNRQIDGINDECWGMVRDAQRTAAKTIEKVYALSTLDCSLCDGIHNNAAACVTLGQKLAKLCYYALNGGSKFLAPELSSVSFVGDTELKLTFDNVALGFMLPSSGGEMTGFTVEDDDGAIAIVSAHANRQDFNNVHLLLERTPSENASISFAWQANPTAFPLLDEVTFLPPLSFYKRKLKSIN